MKKTQRHILNAINSIIKAQEELEEIVSKHSKIIESQGKDIAELEQKVMELRDRAIQAEVSAGNPTKIVAERYGVTPSRISQIAPRKKQ